MFQEQYTLNLSKEPPVKMEHAVDLLSAIAKDDVESFVEIMGNYNSPNLTLPLIEKPKVISILRKEPPIISVILFFHAEECFDYMVNLDADQTLMDKKGRYPHHFAAAGGSIKLLRALDTQKDIFLCFDNKCRTPMNYAIKYGKIDSVNYLWSKGYSFEKINDYYLNFETNPMHMRQGGQFSRFGWGNKVQRNILHEACYSGQMDVLIFMEEHVKEYVYHLRNANNEGYNCLHYACCGGYTDVVDLLLSKGLDIEAQTTDKKTPLIMAIRSGSISCAKILIEAGANIYYTEPSPLVEAARGGFIDILQLLLNKGLPIEHRSASGESALDAAVSKNRVAATRFLLYRGFNWTESKALETHWASVAAANVCAPIVRMFVSDLKVCEKNPKLARAVARKAIVGRSQEVVEILLDEGISFDSISGPDLFNALRNRDKRFLEFVNERIGILDLPEIALTAVRTGDSWGFNKLAEMGLVLTREMAEEEALLENAIRMSKSPEIINAIVQVTGTGALSVLPVDLVLDQVKQFGASWLPILDMLIESGAKIDGSTSSVAETVIKLEEKEDIDAGKVAVAVARRLGVDFTAPIVRKEGTKDEYTEPLIFATPYNKEHVMLIKDLIDAGIVDPNLTNSRGENFFHSLIRGDIRLGAFQYFLSAGTEINWQDCKGKTPLMLCCETGAFSFVPKMLEAGASPFVRDNKGRTALHFAAMSPNSLFAIDCLLEYGADINAVSNLNDTAAINAMKKNFFDNHMTSRSYSMSPMARKESDNKSCAQLILYLLDHGADIRRYPGGGEAARKRAQEMMCPELEERLCKIFHINMEN